MLFALKMIIRLPKKMEFWGLIILIIAIKHEPLTEHIESNIAPPP